jgi:phosphate transport system substrate-binding protein
MNKNIILLLLAVLLTDCSNKSKQSNNESSNDEISGTIQLSGAFALYPMAVKWAEEFRKIHPDVKIDISGGGAGKGMTDVLAGVVDIGMVSREIYQEELEKDAFPIATVRDAVVITINANNPELADIKKTGIKKETAARLWNQEISTWGELLGNSVNAPVRVFTRSDACGAAETFAAWFGRKQENLTATAVFGDPGLAAAVQKERYGIGFNNIAYAYDQQTKKPYEGLSVMPVDVNENGVIDAEEDFYDTVEELIKGINDGIYPSPPARDLYFVTKGRPVKPEVIAFFEYVLTEGQKYVGEIGYMGLPESTLSEELGKINYER